MLLDATTKKIQVVLSGAVTTTQLDVVTAWFDSGATPTGGEADTTTNNTTAVDIVAAPASNYIRQVKYLGVYNADTANATVKIRYNNNGTVRLLCAVTLSPGYTLAWNPKDGWQVVTASGIAFTMANGIPDGTVGAPGLFFAADTDNGLYRAGANNPAMSAGGSQVHSWNTLGNIQPLQPCVQARVTSIINNVTGDGTIYSIVFDTEDLDIGNNFAIGTGIFTAPVSGKYLHSLNVSGTGFSGTHLNAIARIAHSTGANFDSYTYVNGFGAAAVASSIVAPLINMTAGQTTTMRYRVDNSTKTVDIGAAFISVALVA